MNDTPPLLVRSPDTNRGLLAWCCYHARSIANFTHELHDVPNATVYISLGPSAGCVTQLAGITNVTVTVGTGSAITKEIDVDRVVETGLFSEGNQRIYFGRTAHFVTGFVEGFYQSKYGGDVIYKKPEPLALFSNVQQITAVEPVRGYSLHEQLARLRKLPDGWDDEGASRISESTCATADTVIKSLWQITLSHSVTPAVLLGPLPDGSLRFECTYADKELFLTVSENTVEVQGWQPRDAVESSLYSETGPAGAMEYLEWLVK